MNYLWTLPPEELNPVAKDLHHALKIKPIFCRMLSQLGIRNYSEARAFFLPELDKLHDPFLLKGMDIAVRRIEQAIDKGETIMIYGDYDVDGTTAVSLLYSFLEPHYPNLIPYIPDRYREGYGISRQGIEYALDEGVSLAIALDCGIKAVEQIAFAREKELDFIVCDHHTPGPELPAALAILNPKQSDCPYPFKELSGCGVAFKLVQALCAQWQRPTKEWEELLDLLAISIGADIVSLQGENRLLAYHGLKQINQSSRYALKALAEAAGKSPGQLTINDVVFLYGPRINAAGRLEHGMKAVELLTRKDPSLVEHLCAELNQRNTERKAIERQIAEEAEQQIEEVLPDDAYSTVVFAPHWHKGVIGIVASRLIEKYYRPTVVLTEKDGWLTGSARSVEGFDLYAALDQCRNQLTQFGGHKYAAGMTLKKEQFEAFKAAFEQAVKNMIRPDQRVPRLNIAGILEVDSITPRFYHTLQRFAPFGPYNPQPIFVLHRLADAGSYAVGEDRKHLKISLCDSRGRRVEGIGFNLQDKWQALEDKNDLSIAFHLESNVYQGQWRLQLRVLDLKPTQEALGSSPVLTAN